MPTLQWSQVSRMINEITWIVIFSKSNIIKKDEIMKYSCEYHRKKEIMKYSLCKTYTRKACDKKKGRNLVIDHLRNFNGDKFLSSGFFSIKLIYYFL